MQEDCVPGPSSISSDQPSMSKERQAFQRRCRSREEAEEEASDEPADDLGRAIADAKRNCASDLEKKKLHLACDSMFV